MSISMTPLISGLFIFLRFIGMMTTAPLLSINAFSWTIRIALALAIAFLLVGAIPTPTSIPNSLSELALVGISEVLLGVAVGLVASLMLAGMRLAGQLAGIQMGLGFASFIDPNLGEQGEVLSNFLNMVGLVVIVAMNGHLMLIKGLVHSFNMLPPGSAWKSLMHAGLAVPQAGASLFVTGLVVSAPAVAMVFCVNIGMAILSRATPQVNILSVGFIITIAVGLLALALSLPGMGDMLRATFESSITAALRLCTVI
jgi:flagellar biosynthetic protein FliR